MSLRGHGRHRLHALSRCRQKLHSNPGDISPRVVVPHSHNNGWQEKGGKSIPPNKEDEGRETEKRGGLPSSYKKSPLHHVCMRALKGTRAYYKWDNGICSGSLSPLSLLSLSSLLSPLSLLSPSLSRGVILSPVIQLVELETGTFSCLDPFKESLSRPPF